MDKKKLIGEIETQLQSELAALKASARAAHEAATHEESRSEDSHDTRGLEASYLAGAQAQRATEIEALISAFRQLPLLDFGPGVAIAPSALVELQGPSGAAIYFIAPFRGGITVRFEGKQIQVITPQSPVGEELIGRKEGEEIEVEIRDQVREYRIKSVR